MLKQKLKWAILPVLAIGTFVGLNSFTEATGGWCGVTHKSCTEGDTRECNSRKDCDVSGCTRTLYHCETTSIPWLRDCKS